ncbi:hypothetical protein Y032_0103g3531 [Ancylostoma ceylanicum]|uniref:R3H domain-containing protein n=1 Tax=Ancylostoma ceylanicum TaxID=53326 RepID=A0A016TGS9_9BILA|nr:hypothetical protein Y032_0103g3531 [Ancylostoma ceylanicum]
MVSVVGNDAGTVLHTDNELGTSTGRDVIMESENAKASNSPHVTNSVSVDHCGGTSGTSQSESDDHEQQPQCSGQQNIEQERKSTQMDTATAPDSTGASPRSTVRDFPTGSETPTGSGCEDHHRRNCITSQAAGSGNSVLPSVSMPTDCVQRCGSMRRPNVSYASAARTNLTRRTASAEENPSTSAMSTSESSKPAQSAPSSHVRQKLSKQMTVDETCSPIFIGVAEDDYMQPTSNSFVQIQPRVVLNASKVENPRPASVNMLRRHDGPASVVLERPRSVDVVVTSTAVPKAVYIPVTKSRAASAQEAKSSKRKLLKSRSLTQPIAVNLPDEPDYMIPVASTNQRTAGGYMQPVLAQPISMNLPDESDELRPVREYLPERVPGAPTVVRMEKHPYAGTVPSRARQLVRSLAMCGDDDTRLRPPPPPMINSYAPVPPGGVPPRFHRNSSSLSRESSYTDYTSDLSEMELRAFIAATLHKNARDRAMILELEQLFTDFLNDFGEQSLKLPPVSSYNRMLIHRVAVLFGLDHNVDNSGKCVVVSKTAKTKPPDFVFASLIQSNIYTDSRRFCPSVVNYQEIGAGDTMQRRAQSFETGYLYPSADPDIMNPAHHWTQATQRSFEKQPHYHYPMGMMDHGTMMRKAGSFSGVPAIYRSGSGSFENFDRSQMKSGQAHSLASSSHLSPRDPIDETVERFNNASISDRASQISYRSSGSNPPPHPQIYHPYPQVMQYPVGEEVMYQPYQQQQQMYMQPTTMMTPSSVEMYPPQTPIVMPVQQNPPLQQPVPILQCQPQEQLTQLPQAPMEPPTHMIPAQPEYVQYPAQQYPAQVITCAPAPQQYQPIPQPTYQTQYQQVVYPQQVVQPAVMQPQQYQPGFVHAPVQPVQQQYQPPIVQAPVQQQYVPQQPMVHVQSAVYQQPQQMRPQQYAMPVATTPQYVDVPKTEQQPAMPYQPVVYGQWVSRRSFFTDAFVPLIMLSFLNCQMCKIYTMQSLSIILASQSTASLLRRASLPMPHHRWCGAAQQAGGAM